MTTFEKILSDNEKYNKCANNYELASSLKADYTEIYTKLRDNLPKYADHILGAFSSFCPFLQHITIEALKPEDLPNNISQNGIFISFKIDLMNHTIEVGDSGHIYLSREEQKATYLAMTNIKKLCKARKVKWHRKYTYKSIEDLIKHITAFYERVMECVEEYTGGYPYKQGNGWTDPQMNEKMVV